MLCFSAIFFSFIALPNWSDPERSLAMSTELEHEPLSVSEKHASRFKS